ncbi:hypothetical protein PRZ48_006846 [Zasmidium cellare]|uniref:Xylanolytic transcriptional activator regulatory domain-containing protein n=1 Tax=Zasmidium cellare TaxID=395010 RepID=A0ABR0EIJ6_ZASCE|nr:hypothetical protein PRZ48_006846 [Zasmidium cellare]
MNASNAPFDGEVTGNAPKRRRIVQNQSHRSNNACRRCKAKKAKCEFNGGGALGYTAALEERVAFLESQLAEREADISQTQPRPAPNATSMDSPHFQVPIQSPNGAINGHIPHAPGSQATLAIGNPQQSPEKLEIHAGLETPVTIFTLLEAGSQTQGSNLPELPSPETAETLFESAYLYTQARYCIVDWAMVRQWHDQRLEICSGAYGGVKSSKIGAFFIWIKYYGHALAHLRPVLDSNNLVTVQGLLAITQYNCRATCGPPPWHLVGVALRLCIEKGYHRQVSDTSITTYEREARKRAFWCAYVFDRMISIALQRPFGLDDRDIDLDVQFHQTSTNSTNMEAARISFSNHLTSLLGELDDWRREVPPRTNENSIPQQNEDRTQAMYLQTALLLIRPVLCRDSVDHDLIIRFATIAADACEVRLSPGHMNLDESNMIQNGKEICFRAQSHTSAIQMYNSFYCGITLLQCLALKPDALSFRRVLRAIKACSNTLAVYTSSVDTASTLARLFDKLSDHRFSDVESSVMRPGSPSAIAFLRKVAFSDPSQAETLLQAVPDDEDTVVSGAEDIDALLSLTEPMGASQWLNWEDPFASFEFNDFELS